MDIATKQDLAEEAFELDRKLSKCLLNIRDNFLELGEIAWELKRGKLYRLIESEAKSWEHFISLRIVGIKRASLDNYARTSQTLRPYLTVKMEDGTIKKRDIKLNRALDITRIVNRLPEAEQEGKIRELIESAEVLPKEGWDNAVKVENGRLPSDMCSHENQEPWSKCKDCGRFFKM